MGAQTAVVFRVLGPLEVWFDGAPVKIGGARQRALLAMLLLNANRVVPREQLIDELLNDARPETADHTLRVQVSRLRSVVNIPGAPEPRLVRQAPGYRLRVDSGELDLDVFERLVAQAQRATHGGDHELASSTLREAESLWRGRPLADIEAKPFAQIEIERLAEMRLVATEDRIDADLTLGRHRQLVPELERMVAEHPLRERVRGQLMLALYRSGRQADALAAYRTGRSHLVDQLGVEPGPGLRELERGILRQDATLDPPRNLSPRPAGEPSVSDEQVVVAPSVLAPVSGRRRRTRRWATVGVAVATVALGAILVAATMGPEGERTLQLGRSLAGDGVVLVSPADGAIRATVALRSAPSDMAAGFGSLWVTEALTGDVVRIDPSAHRIAATIPLGARPSRMVAGGGAVWVLDPVGRTVSAIDPATDTVAQTVTVAVGASDVAFDAGSLWVLDRRDGTVSRLDPGTGLRRATVRIGGHPSSLTTVDGDIWVTDDELGTLERIDPRGPAVTKTVRVGGAPTAIAATNAGTWVLDRLAATVSRLGVHGRTLAVGLGGAPSTLTTAGGNVWVGDARTGIVLGLDPRTMSVVTRVRIGGGVSSLAVDQGLWVAVQGIAAHPGGSLTAVGSYAVIDTVDPAASTSWNVPPPQGLGLANDGLVTLDHVAGPDGSRLVPDLALALPTPADRGRTYGFTIRPGIRYSNGATLRPRDVTHSFERLFAIGSAGAPLYAAIRGATACIRTPSRCDLSEGIVADDRTGTVTFHLTRPDPDFIYKLTISYAYVLPRATPERQARTPLPATGPYMITRYFPGRELRLARNPYYHEWSAAAQPSGYPDRITIPLGLSPAQADSAIASGQVDFDPNLGRLPGRDATDLLVNRRVQVQIHPALATGFLFLNTNVPPFTYLAVRRAFNLAYDRSAAVDGWGERSPRSPPASCSRPRSRDTTDTAPTPVVPVTGSGREPILPGPSASSLLPAPGACASSSGTASHRLRAVSTRPGLRWQPFASWATVHRCACSR